MMNEISQTEKNKHCEILLIRGIEKTKPEAKLIDRENRLCLPKAGHRYTLPVIR